MLEIEKIVQEFDEVYAEFEEAKRINDFHEASDMKSYMYGLTRSMTIVLECNIDSYSIEDGRKVDNCVSKLNRIDDVS